MTMTNDELRALADALEPMARAPRFEDMDVPAFCRWLRAQADAQPVAWMYEHDGCVDTPVFTVNRWTKCEEPWNESPLFLRPAPAAPQAEPCIGNDPACPCQDGDACHYKDAADGTKAWPVPQAEPKREPLSDDEILDILDIATAADLRFSMYSDDVETRAAIKRLARAVERAAYERAKQACMEIGKEIVCPEECAAAIDALGGSDGN